MIPSDVFSIVTVIIFTSLKRGGSYFVDITIDRNQHWTNGPVPIPLFLQGCVL